MLDCQDHPIIVEFMNMTHEMFPDFIYKIVYFNWDEGQYKEKLKRINDRLEDIYNQLNETVWKDRSIQQKLKQQLIDQLPSMKKLYQDLTNTITEQEWEAYEKWLDDLIHKGQK